jgi:hypothetical protein
MAEAMTSEERTMTVQKADTGPVLGQAGASAIRLVLAVSLIALGAVLWGAQHPDSASAESKIHAFRAFPTTSEAGGHPNVFTELRVGNRLTEEPIPCDCNDPKDITIETPAGIIANTHAVATCTAAELVTLACPPDSQVGIVALVTGIFPPLLMPLHRTVEQGDSAALYAFVLPLGLKIIDYLSINARTGTDYGLNFKTVGITHFLPVAGFDTIFWGVPIDPIHDKLRFPIYGGYIPCFAESELDLISDTLGQTCLDGLALEPPEGGEAFEVPKEPVGTSIPAHPFTQNPTTCAGPLETRVHVYAYDQTETESSAEWPETTGCDQLSFFPSLAANPTTTQTDTASGLEVDLKVPQFQSPGTPSPSEIKANTVAMPEGFTFNSNGSDGKIACTDVEARFGSEEAAQCPEFSKIGTVELDSAALPAPINGFAYLGEPKPNDRYRVILTADGFGTHVKLAGSTVADPSTGRLTLSLQDLPQTPFQEFRLHLFGSERGIFATPNKCQDYEVKSTFTPWASELSDQTSTQFFGLDSGPNGEQCPGSTRPFAPALAAGSADNTAGAHSSYGLKITRQDGEQNLTGLEVSQPPGLAATLKGVPYCPESAIATLSSAGYLGSTELSTPACPAASQVGFAATTSGAGTKPLNLAGKVYLAGPYNGAPLSLLTVVPAVTGPYDLGNVAVRAALDVNPATAQVSVRSDPLPQIIGGIPLRTRSLQIVLDRSGFALNPTNCKRTQVVASVSGDEGGQKSPAANYQVANCAGLNFGPKLNLSLRGSTKRRGHPALRAVLNANSGEANIKRTVVALPRNLILDNSRIGTVCTRAQFAAENCPAGSVMGNASVSTPLLDAPLSGPVYLRTSGHALPDLVVALKGQFDIELVGRIGTTKAGGLRTVFNAVPDAPVSRFVLNLNGKRRGLLQSTVSLCKGGRRAAVKMVGQNGVRLSRNTKLQSKCGSAKRKRKRAARHSRGNR